MVIMRLLCSRHTRPLRWRDLDLDRGELRVMQNVHDIRKDRVTEHMGYRIPGFRFGPPKTHRSKRPVSMPIELMPDYGHVLPGVDREATELLSEAIRRAGEAHGTRMAHGGDGEPKP
jgi:hypothetical protein